MSSQPPVTIAAVARDQATIGTASRPALGEVLGDFDSLKVQVDDAEILWCSPVAGAL
jgi:hypothetical protein